LLLLLGLLLAKEITRVHKDQILYPDQILEDRPAEEQHRGHGHASEAIQVEVQDKGSSN